MQQNRCSLIRNKILEKVINDGYSQIKIKLLVLSVMIRINLAAFLLFTASLAAGIDFVDQTENDAPWAGCWCIAHELSKKLNEGLETSANPGLHSLSSDNVRLDLTEYSTSPLEIAPKSALFPADSYRCPTRLQIKARLKLVSCTGEVVYKEEISFDQVLDDDQTHYDYCKINPGSFKFPSTPLAKAHQDFIQRLLSRFDYLQRQRML